MNDIEKKAFTVRQVNNYIKKAFDQDHVLSGISVKGEVSNCKYHSSGHIYFSLKDESGTLSCIMFAGNRSGLSFKLADGMNVIVSGRVTVYEKTGSYQLYAVSVKQAGLGDLYAKFLEIKKELEEMGMFDPIYKKPIPKYAINVGIVTAGTGAALQDIINVSKRRNPYVRLMLCPCYVQGERAPSDISRAIKLMDSRGADVIIVGRGGGSIEDLWAFNEKEVAQAIFDCRTPVISAVGHEVDFTIADFVSDMRAPTPSAAAELAVFSFEEFKNERDALKAKLKTLMDGGIKDNVHNAASLQYELSSMIQYQIKDDLKKAVYLNDRIKLYSPQAYIFRKKNEIADCESKIENLVHDRIREDSLTIRDLKNRIGQNIKDGHNSTVMTLKLLSQRLEDTSPVRKMSLGCALITDIDDKFVKSTEDINAGDHLNVNMIDGRLECTVIDKKRS